jgi:hypothetical protein
MQLEQSTEAVCPLCRDEMVVMEPNKSEYPYFRCSTFRSTVNLRTVTDKSETMFSQLTEADDPESFEGYVLDDPTDTPPEMEAEADADADGEADDEPQTLGDVLNTEEK